MWRETRLSISGETAPVCSVVAAHPWVRGLGREEDSGFYLSPPNAVEYLAGRLVGAASRLDVTAIMLTAPTLAAFITQLAAAAAVFPVPQLTQLLRRARTAETLATTRMQLPAAAGGLPAAATLAVSTLRRAAGAQSAVDAISSAVPASVAGLTAGLAEFATQRAALLEQARSELSELTAAVAAVWTVSTVLDTPAAARAMREDVPHADHVFTAALLFAGDDLAPLRAMLRDL